jgi:hypothetical protein
MPRVVFEPTIPVSERAKTVHDLSREATVISCYGCNESFVHLQMYEVELQFIDFSHSRAAWLTNGLYSLPSNNDVCTSSVLRMLPLRGALIYVVNSVFWNVTPCSVVTDKRRSGGGDRLSL